MKSSAFYRYFICLSYNGSAFNGWQKQDNAPSVQALLEQALYHVAKVTGGITGCGRTDTGVHAKIYFAHLDHKKAFSTDELVNLTFRLNRYLPAEIAVHEIVPVLPWAHARYSPVYREYKYYLLKSKDPFLDKQAWFSWEKIDMDAMNEAAEFLKQFTDFECFSKKNSQVKTYDCKIYKAHWSEEGSLLIFTVQADRFLRNMVRAIVGTLMDIGRHKINLDDLRLILESRNRSRAGLSVPAKGLFLTDVVYPPVIFCGKPVPYLPGSTDEIEAHDKTDTKFHYSPGNETDE